MTEGKNFDYSLDVFTLVVCSKKFFIHVADKTLRVILRNNYFQWQQTHDCNCAYTKSTNLVECFAKVMCNIGHFNKVGDIME